MKIPFIAAAREYREAFEIRMAGLEARVRGNSVNLSSELSRQESYHANARNEIRHNVEGKFAKHGKSIDNTAETVNATIDAINAREANVDAYLKSLDNRVMMHGHQRSRYDTDTRSCVEAVQNDVADIRENHGVTLYKNKKGIGALFQKIGPLEKCMVDFYRFKEYMLKRKDDHDAEIVGLTAIIDNMSKRIIGLEEAMKGEYEHAVQQKQVNAAMDLEVEGLKTEVDHATNVRSGLLARLTAVENKGK